MSDPVDLTNLRTMTDGDKEIEVMLFEEFYYTCEDMLSQMADCMDGTQNEAWRKYAHAMKGVAYNLGAMRFGDLCRSAQDECEAPSAQKQRLLEEMNAEYRQAKAFLQAVYP